MHDTYVDQSDRQEYPEHQLVPQKGGRYQTVFHGPPGTDVGDLHCDLEPYVEGEGQYVVNHSGWRPDEDQVAQLEAGAHVRVSLWTHPIPPMAVSIEPPVCQCHGEAMTFDRDELGYYCTRSNDPRSPHNRHVPTALEDAKESFTAVDVEDDEPGQLE